MHARMNAPASASAERRGALGRTGGRQAGRLLETQGGRVDSGPPRAPRGIAIAREARQAGRNARARLLELSATTADGALGARRLPVLAVRAGARRSHKRRAATAGCVGVSCRRPADSLVRRQDGATWALRTRTHAEAAGSARPATTTVRARSPPEPGTYIRRAGAGPLPRAHATREGREIIACVDRAARCDALVRTRLEYSVRTHERARAGKSSRWRHGGALALTGAPRDGRRNAVSTSMTRRGPARRRAGRSARVRNACGVDAGKRTQLDAAARHVCRRQRRPVAARARAQAEHSCVWTVGSRAISRARTRELLSRREGPRGRRGGLGGGRTGTAARNDGRRIASILFGEGACIGRDEGAGGGPDMAAEAPERGTWPDRGRGSPVAGRAAIGWARGARGHGGRACARGGRGRQTCGGSRGRGRGQTWADAASAGRRRRRGCGCIAGEDQRAGAVCVGRLGRRADWRT